MLGLIALVGQDELVGGGELYFFGVRSFNVLQLEFADEVFAKGVFIKGYSRSKWEISQIKKQ